ncbi:MAG: hypothetical protein WCX48_07995 [Bacteroidales bacterium]|jgi:hypothetical protein
MTESRFTGEYTKKGYEAITDEERESLNRAFNKKIPEKITQKSEPEQIHGIGTIL